MATKSQKTTKVEPKFGLVERGDKLFSGIEVSPLTGGYMALTVTENREFKTLGAAIRWLDRRGYLPTGER